MDIEYHKKEFLNSLFRNEYNNIKDLINKSEFFLTFSEETIKDISPNNVQFNCEEQGGYKNKAYCIPSQDIKYVLKTDKNFGNNIASATFALWIYHTSFFSNDYVGYIMSRVERTLFSNNENTVNGISRCNSSTILSYHWRDDPNTYNYRDGIDIICNLNKWMHITLVVISNKQTWYINGNISHEINYNIHPASFPNMTIGGDPCSGDGNYNKRIQTGYYKDVCFFTKALTHCEIKRLYSIKPILF